MNKKNRHGYRIGIAASSLLGMLVFMPVPAQDGMQGIRMGDGILYPYLGVSLESNDNIFLQESTEKSSLITVVSPGMQYEYDRDRREALVSLNLESGRVHDSTADNYDDARLNGEGHFYTTERLTLSANAGLSREHETRGTTSTVGTPLAVSEPNVFRLSELGAGMAYGADAVGAPRVEVAVEADDRQYLNNRTVTVFQDRETRRVNASLFYKVMPVTSLVVEGSWEDLDYDLDAGNLLDSVQVRWLAGLSWEATSQTDGFVKVGRVKKEFDSATRTDSSSSSWEVGVNWQPLSYSRFTLVANRDFEESDGTGDFVDSRKLSLSWAHSWTSYFTTSMHVEKIDDKYASTLREDKIPKFGVRADYQIKPWLSIGAHVDVRKRDSNVSGLDYDNRIVGINAMITM